MRKKFLIPLVLLASALTIGHISGLKAHKEVLADPVTTYIPMSASAFTDGDAAENAGDFELSTATYWPGYAGYHSEDGDSFNYSFFALDTFFCGERNEGWTGTLTLKSWKQSTQYVYFTWGGATNSDENVYLEFHCGDKTYTQFNDTSMGNPMLLRCFKIPDDDFAELMDGVSDFDMYISLHDGRTGGYGFHNFGYLHVNQTAEQTGDAMRFYLNKLGTDTRASQIRIRKEIMRHYYTNASLSSVFLRPSSNINDDFDSNGDFLNHWYFDYDYASNMNWGLHFNQIIGSNTDDHRPADTNMPFNNQNGGFFRGWYQNDQLGGFVDGDGSIYRFISRPFVLSNTGLVSVKMAGSASLHVIDAETRQDLVWADVNSFKMSGNWDNLAVDDFNTVTMVRHVINLEAYLGRKIHLAIADVRDRDWGAVYFDELRVNYENYPGFKVDAFTQTNGDTFHIYKTDKYINSTIHNGETNPEGMKYVAESAINCANDNEIKRHVDNSPIKAAYNFLTSYYSSLRSPAVRFDYANANADAKADVVNSYLSLNSSARAIVNSSKDVTHAAYEGNWYATAVDVSNAIATPLAALVAGYTARTVTFEANGGTGSMESEQRLDGRNYTMPSCSLTAPSGKRFFGWNTAADGTGTPKNPTDSFALSEDMTFYAVWINEDIESTESLSALRFHYAETAVVGEYDFSEVALRFGGFISEALWSELSDSVTIEGYGVIVSKSASIEERYEAAAGNSVEEKLTAICDANTKRVYATGDTPETATPQQKAYMGDVSSTKYYTWQVRVNVGSNFTTNFTAVAYIKVNGGIIFLQEVTCSAKSIAAKVLLSINVLDDIHDPIQCMSNMA